jgi:hypothetical protein
MVLNPTSQLSPNFPFPLGYKATLNTGTIQKTDKMTSGNQIVGTIQFLALFLND